MLSALLITASFGLISSTPIHDNTLGVTECQDCLRDLYPTLSYRKQPGENFDCDNGMTDLFNCLDSCRPSDPLRMLAYLREITLARNWNKCYNKGQDASKCKGALLCLYGSMDENQFLCDDSEVPKKSIACFNDMFKSGCSYAAKLDYVITAGLEEHCHGKGCIALNNKSLNVYRTVPHTQCSKYDVIDEKGNSHSSLRVPGGTIFDVRPQFCKLKHATLGKCYN